MKFVAIRKNHTFGRVWDVGETLESTSRPNHHFELVREGAPQAKSEQAKDDPMKPHEIRSDKPIAFSEMAEQAKAKGGFASAMEKPDNPFKRGRKRK